MFLKNIILIYPWILNDRENIVYIYTKNYLSYHGPINLFVL